MRAPLEEVAYQTNGMTAVMVARAWVLYAWFAGAWAKRWLRFATGHNGVRIARVLYALALIAFGLSHFFYLHLTAPLVPEWLGWPVGWSYFTGLVRFMIICGIGAVSNVGVASWIYANDNTWWIAGLGGALMGAVWNYAVSSVFVWRMR